MKKKILHCLKYVVILLISFLGLFFVLIDYENWSSWYLYLFRIFTFLSLWGSVALGVEWIYDKFSVLFKRLFKNSSSDQEVPE